MTIYEFATALFNDDDFNAGGIGRKEREWIDAVGFEYKVKEGCINEYGEDLSAFYEAMETLRMLHKKFDYEKKEQRYC